MIHTTRTVADVRIAFETYIKIRGDESSYRLFGQPKIGCGFHDGKIVNPSWVWTVEILKNGEIYRDMCLVFDEQTDSVCFWNADGYNWREATENFVFSDADKDVEFFVGDEPRAEICYKNLYEMTPAAEQNVRDINSCLVLSDYAYEFANQHPECKAEMLTSKLYKGFPSVVARVESRFGFSYFNLYLGLSSPAQSRHPKTRFHQIIKREFGAGRFADPIDGKAYLMHTKDYFGKYPVYGLRMIPVRFNGARFEYVPFREADFDVLPYFND